MTQVMELKAPTVDKLEGKKAIRKDIQMKVDRYIEIHKVYKSLEARLSNLKESIMDYMDIQELTEILGSEEGRVSLVYQNRTPVNSRYTAYNYEMMKSILTPNMLDACSVLVIDKLLVENLCHRHMIDKDLANECKETTQITNFTVKSY